MSQLSAAKHTKVRNVVHRNPMGMSNLTQQKLNMEMSRDHYMKYKSDQIKFQGLMGKRSDKPPHRGVVTADFAMVGGVTDHSVYPHIAAERRAAAETDALLAEFGIAKSTDFAVEDVQDELLETIQANYEQTDRALEEAARVAREPHVASAAAAMAHELRDLPADPSDPEASIADAERAMADDSVSMRAKRMLMGELDLGQHRFKHTDTMLPRKHQAQMTPLLKLFGMGIIVVDVFAGEHRAAIGFLAPLSSQSRWTPGDDYIVQTASEIQSQNALRPEDVGTVQCEVIARMDLGENDKWQLGKLREHHLNEFPRKHLSRLARIMGSTEAFKLMWSTMTLVFIWEREPRDDLAALIRFVATL